MAVYAFEDPRWVNPYEPGSESAKIWDSRRTPENFALFYELQEALESAEG